MYHANRMMIDHANQLAEERVRRGRERRHAASLAPRRGVRAGIAGLLVALAGRLEPARRSGSATTSRSAGLTGRLQHEEAR